MNYASLPGKLQKKSVPDTTEPSPAENPSSKFSAHKTEPAESPATTPLRDADLASKNPSLIAPAEQVGNTSVRPPETQLMIIGKKQIYCVRKGDTLRLIGAKFGVNWKLVAQQNQLNPKKFLKQGQKLTINTRKIVPMIIQDGIVINIPDRTLYFFKNRKLEKALPVALGRKNTKDLVIWQTPTGKFRILSKLKNPAWHVPASIRKEMEHAGKPVTTIVLPGEKNPLGKFALMTSMPGILIHSTLAPESIYTYSSHGCIRVFPSNMEAIFNEIPINTKGEIIYQPVKLAVSESGNIFIEVHHDVYDRHENLKALAKQLIEKNNLELLVDWDKVNASLKRKAGIPEDITGPTTPQQVQARKNLSPVSILPKTSFNTGPLPMTVRRVLQ
jgi:L,D-transpeptidase ErfK/SrfK